MVVVTKHDRRLKLLPIPITLPFVPMQLDIISCICSSEYTITLEGLFGSRDISRFGTFFNAKHFIGNIVKWKFFVVYRLCLSVNFVFYLFGTGSFV